MANELSVTVKLHFSKSGASITKAATANVDVTGDSFVCGVLEVGTVEEALTQLADLGTPGYLYLKNMDATNYVQFGANTGTYSLRLKAGEIALLRWDGATIWAKANTAACLVEYCCVED